MSEFDPLQFKAVQRHDWGVSAPGWKQHWAIWERAAKHLNVRLIELAEVSIGDRVLDVATGLGQPALTLARHVGQTGRVVATDLSPQMLALARDEAHALGLQGIIEFHEMDAEAPDLPPQTFQAILCRMGLMFLPNPAVALGALRRLLVPGGRFAAAVWGPPERAPAMSLPTSTVRRELQLPPPPPDTPGVFSLADVYRLEKVFVESGYDQPHTDRLTVTLEYASADEFCREREATSGTIRALLANVSGPKREAIWRAMSDAVRPYTDVTGQIRIPNEVLCVVARNGRK